MYVKDYRLSLLKGYIVQYPISLPSCYGTARKVQGPGQTFDASYKLGKTGIFSFRWLDYLLH